LERYRALADIETGFKVLKNEIEMAPMFHRLPTRIVAHGAICFMALVLNRYLRQQLKSHGREESPGDCSNNCARSASAPSAKAPGAANP
jgi:transposase